MKTKTQRLVVYAPLAVIIAFQLSIGAGTASAEPGILQIATRKDFWSNQFPDSLFLLQHYRYVSGDIATPGGKQDFEQHLSLTRLINGSYRFGDKKQFQFVIQGVLPFTSATIGDDSIGGFADPLTYTAVGWNDDEKKNHVQLFSIVRYPFGDNELTTDAFGNLTGLAYERIWDNGFQLDASTGYWIEFDRQGASNTSGKSYWNVNGIIGYNFSKKFSVYSQWDYKLTDESEINGIGQDDDGYNLGTALGATLNFPGPFQIDAKVYTDLNNDNEALDEDISFNVRFFVLF